MHLTKTHTNGEVWDFAKIERKFIDEESSSVSQNVAKKEKRILCVMEKKINLKVQSNLENPLTTNLFSLAIHSERWAMLCENS